MAFSTAQIESAGADAWTGKLTSVVYESTGDAAAYLSSIGKAAFAGAAEDAQDVALLRATEDAEDAIRDRFRGRPLVFGQGLLLPARAAYAGRRLLPTDPAQLALDRRVLAYLRGIRLLAEEIAGDTYMPLASVGAGAVESERTSRGAIVYREGANPAALRSNHPEAWAKIVQILPRII